MEGLVEDHLALKKFLLEEGRGKHVLMDEVPITLGFQGIITSEALSKHWEWLLDIRNTVKSITIIFRPNDQTYVTDICLQDVKPGGLQIFVLDRVMRNSRNIAKLFLTVEEHLHRSFISSEGTHQMEMGECRGKCLPILFTVPSCYSLHGNKCKNETVCRTMRASAAIESIREVYSAKFQMPLFVVVDDATAKKLALVNTITATASFPILYLDGNGEFHGKPSPGGSPPLVIVNEEEIMGCHLNNITVIVDFPESQWKNYSRLIATNDENKILLIEEEDLKTGKFSHIVREFPDMNIQQERIDKREFPDMNIQQERIDKEGLRQKLMRMCEGNKDNVIDELVNSHRAPLPRMEMDTKGREEDENDLKKMLEARVSGIFGYSASGKSQLLHKVIERIIELWGRVLFLHCGSVLSQKLCRRRWGVEENMEIVDIDSREIQSLNDIFELERKKAVEYKGKVAGPLVVIVEDCPLRREMEYEINAVIERLKEGMKLIIAFKPHSNDPQRVCVESLTNVLEMNPDCVAIKLQSQPTNELLLKHIQKNEIRTSLKLKAKSLPISSVLDTYVFGPPVLYINYKCSGRHFGYICKGGGPCSKSMGSASWFNTDSLLNILSSLLAPLRGATDQQLHILVSDEDLLTSLQGLETDLDMRVIHPKNFRGCQASIVISVDVGDDWLLEVISRARTQLIIIDNIPSHADLWKTMIEKRVVQTWDTHPMDIERGPRILLTLDEKEQFLRKILGDEGLADHLPSVERGAALLKRPIVLIGEKFSWTFIPTEEEAKSELSGILLFAQDFPPYIHILPIVPSGGKIWMDVEKLPPVYGERKIPPSLVSISFRGRVDVKWRAHTVPLLWALDRSLAGLTPLSPALLIWWISGGNQELQLLLLSQFRHLVTSFEQLDSGLFGAHNALPSIDDNTR
ncbi:unnamed protein product [Darwinula stevensoni]|uniref:Uncharacterized protein n=1 Tax=Darwinula stevensoni TaxID=69355 RepID=A0A7R9A323_9CRUS|nr:unnamed protein product [Darwinula stevensoni]CAG0889856.1 unnamed protein product [Darwinula stevensoni]